MTVVVRFAPSPTGYLHIGGARTAFINWLFAKKNNGKFLLRIEDTDEQRSDSKCTDAILTSMKWLNLDYDGDITIQSKQQGRHAEVAHKLVEDGKAYYCNCTAERMQSLREHQIQNGIPPKYDGYCREKKNTSGVIRLKVPNDLNEITIKDIIKGTVTVKTDQLDDLVVLRSNGTPTYMLSSVVDDHDMGITHVIRGDDHFTNTFRQATIYKACDWSLPTFAHIPLIHGDDGAKLSKRHGAVGVHNYKDMGYLPEAMLLYIYTLGFGNNVDIVKGIPGLIDNFNLKKMAKSPSRMDFSILNRINQEVMKKTQFNSLIDKLYDGFTTAPRDLVEKALPDVVSRCKTLIDISIMIDKIYLSSDPIPEMDAEEMENIKNISSLLLKLSKDDFTSIDKLQTSVSSILETLDIPRNLLMKFLRIIITRQNSTPNIYNVMYALGYDRVLKRLQ